MLEIVNTQPVERPPPGERKINVGERDRIDPESRLTLEAYLEIQPGGFNAIPDIAERRAWLSALQASARAELGPNVAVSMDERVVPGRDGDPDITVRVYRPVGVEGTLPGIFFIHGGGMVLGDLDSEILTCELLSEQIGAVVVSTDYRKAPENPYPAAVNDCYASLEWVGGHFDELGIDPDRLAVFGASAGGGLAVAVSLLARDRGGPKLCFQMPIYPMLDDRNETTSSYEITEVGIWDRGGNLEAWEMYLAGQDADHYAAPARATNLTELPPTFIDVGTMDLFRDEDIAFVGRLVEAGVPTEFHLYPGAYHASENFAPEAELSQRIWATRLAALRRALAPRE
jgi:acetyl esterase/lipase